MEQTLHQGSVQQTFHEHLRTLTRDAVRVVIEEVMREELKQFLDQRGGDPATGCEHTRSATLKPFAA